MNTKFGKFIESKLFYVFFWIVLLGAACYAGIRTNLLIAGADKTGHPVIAVLVSIVLILASGIALSLRSLTPAIRRFKRISGVYISFFLYYVLLLIPGSLACLIPAIQPYRTRLIAAAAVISIAVTVYGYIHAGALKTVRYPVTLGSGETSYHVVLLSDLHLGVFVDSGHIRKTVDIINRIRPDVVFLAGDILDVDDSILTDPEQLNRISALFRQIKTRDGMFAVLGNHDPDPDNPRFRTFLKESGITLLYNEARELPEVNVIGRARLAGDTDLRTPLNRLMEQTNPGKPVIVVDHDPQGIREAVCEKADLVLCGHTHKGQFFPMTLLTKYANGTQYFYGHMEFGKTHGIISAGTGYFTMPIRIGTDSEIVDIPIRLP